MNLQHQLHKFPKGFQNTYAKASSIVRSHPLDAKPLLENLLQYPLLKENPYINGMVEYLYGEALFDLSQSTSALPHLTVAYQLLMDCKAWEEATHVQAFIGLTYMAEGSHANAMVSFSKEFILSQMHDIPLAFYKANLQLGECFYAVKQFDTAYTYYLAADVLLEQHPEISEQTESIPILYASLVITLCAMKQYDLAQTNHQKLLQELHKAPRFINGSYHIIPTTILKLSMSEKRDEPYVNHIVERLIYHNDQSGNTLLIDIEFLKFLSERHYYVQALEFANYMEQTSHHSDYFFIKQNIYECKARIYHALQQQEMAYQQLVRYVEISEQMHQSDISSSLSLLEIRNELEAASRQNEILKIVSYTDHLTKIANRRSLEDYFRDAIQKAHQNQETITFAMLDVDDFKTVNDGHGHQIGDQCLALLGSILLSKKNEQCFCARYGGDEFSMLFHASGEYAIDVLKDIQTEFENSCLNQFGFPVYISFGVYSTVPEEDATIASYIAKADHNLYHAKVTQKKK